MAPSLSAALGLLVTSERWSSLHFTSSHLRPRHSRRTTVSEAGGKIEWHLSFASVPRLENEI